ncbi:hypothetical protein [Pendulispora albinea]|uniref:Uncharacterized protein n=1 Tax=Pendulispora albinea TaxID=2741071 RepID=A0ABZ2LTW7_9BACT
MADPSEGGPARVRRMFVAREARMFPRFARWRATLPENAKVALLAHDLHVARDSEVLWYGRTPHDLPMWTSFGTRIERDQPGSLWVSWLLYGRGTRYLPDKAGGISQVHLREGALEAHLAATPGSSFVVVDRAPAGSVVDRPIPFGTETRRLGPHSLIRRFDRVFGDSVGATVPSGAVRSAPARLFERGSFS